MTVFYAFAGVLLAAFMASNLFDALSPEIRGNPRAAAVVFFAGYAVVAAGMALAGYALLRLLLG